MDFNSQNSVVDKNSERGVPLQGVTASNADLSAWPLRGGREMMALSGYLKSHHTEERVH